MVQGASRMPIPTIFTDDLRRAVRTNWEARGSSGSIAKFHGILNDRDAHEQCHISPSCSRVRDSMVSLPNERNGMARILDPFVTSDYAREIRIIDPCITRMDQLSRVVL